MNLLFQNEQELAVDKLKMDLIEVWLKSEILQRSLFFINREDLYLFANAIRGIKNRRLLESFFSAIEKSNLESYHFPQNVFSRENKRIVFDQVHDVMKSTPYSPQSSTECVKAVVIFTRGRFQQEERRQDAYFFSYLGEVEYFSRLLLYFLDETITPYPESTVLTKIIFRKPLGYLLAFFDCLLQQPSFLDLFSEEFFQNWYVWFRATPEATRSYTTIKYKRKYSPQQIMSVIRCSEESIRARVERDSNAFLGLEKKFFEVKSDTGGIKYD